MLNFKNRLASFLTVIAVLLVSSLPVSAAEDILTLELKTGSDVMKINGTVMTVEEPYISKDAVFLPFDSVFETFGAEICYNSDNTVELTYRDINVLLSPENKEYTFNQRKKELSIAPKSGDSGLMVPLEFINDNFDVETEYNSKTGEIKIVMYDDGALTDLSFLTDSIAKPMAGDSYYNWSVSVPNGSRLAETSFNSKYVYIDNADRGLAMEIEIMPARGMLLEDYYNNLLENPLRYFESEPEDNYFSGKTSPAYAQFLYLNMNDEAVAERIYIYADRIYSFRLTDYYEVNPASITKSTYLKGLLDSFRLDYTGDNNLIQDLTSVQFGLVKFESYTAFDRTANYRLWEMEVLPEWELIDYSYNDILNTTLGVDKKNYINVRVSDAGKATSIISYGTSILSRYEKYFNTDRYKLLTSGESEMAGFRSFNMKYLANIGKEEYLFDESFVLSNGLIYNITVKTPAAEENSDLMKKLVSSFQIFNVEQEQFKDALEHYNSIFGSQRLGLTDNTVLHQNKSYSWSLSLPGFWNKEASLDSSYQIFTNPYADMEIAVEAADPTELKGETDFGKQFGLLGYLIENYKLIESEKRIIKAKGSDVIQVVYEMEDEEEQMYGKITCRIFTKGSISYCYLSIVSDLCSSEKALKELDSIWGSFDTGIK